jgi:hypothetical protein
MPLPNIKFNCVWCDEDFISNIYLEKHSVKCKVNTAYVLLLEKCKEKDKQIEEKDLQDNLS